MDALVAPWEAEPTDAGNQLIQLNAPDHVIRPIARELPVTTAFPWPAEQNAPEASTEVIANVGTVEVDPPGCALLEITSDSWTCQLAQGCMSGSTFATVRDVGCDGGAWVLDAPYAPGRTRGRNRGSRGRGLRRRRRSCGSPRRGARADRLAESSRRLTAIRTAGTVQTFIATGVQ